MRPSKNQAQQDKVFIAKEGMFEIWIFDPVYKANIHLLWPCGEEKENAWIKRVCGIEVEKDDATYLAACRMVEWKGGCAQVMSFDFDIEEDGIKFITSLVHESAHATENILFRAGMNHTKETCEAFAYLQESIVHRMLVVLDDFKKHKRKLKLKKAKLAKVQSTEHGH